MDSDPELSSESSPEVHRPRQARKRGRPREQPRKEDLDDDYDPFSASQPHVSSIADVQSQAKDQCLYSVSVAGIACPQSQCFEMAANEQSRGLRKCCCHPHASRLVNKMCLLWTQYMLCACRQSQRVKPLIIILTVFLEHCRARARSSDGLLCKMLPRELLRPAARLKVQQRMMA